MTSVNPDGHYGLLMKGAGYQFVIRLLTNICVPDEGCAEDRAGRSDEKITLSIDHLGAGLSSKQVISGRAFAVGDPMTTSLAVANTSIDCTVQ